MAIGINYPDAIFLLRILDRYLNMCPMIKQSTFPKLFSSDDIKGQSISKMIKTGRWFIFKDENITKTVAFAFVAQFTSPSQIMKFLTGLVSVIKKNSSVCHLSVYSTFDQYGLPVDDWEYSLGSHMTSLDLDAFLEYNFVQDGKDVFSKVYRMFNVLYPKDSIYEYLHELSGGYIATNMLYDKISQGFEQKFGSSVSVFNLSWSVTKYINLKPVKYLKTDSDLAKSVRFMALRVAIPDSKPLFFDYSLRTGDSDNADKIELAEIIRDNLRHKRMSVLKSRFVQTQFDVYVVMNLGAVWLDSVHMHYYIMMQIKRNNDKGNIADFLSQFIEV